MHINDVLSLLGFTGLVGSGISTLVLCILCIYSLIRGQKENNQLISQITGIQLGLIAIPVIVILFLLGLNAFEFPIVFDAVELDMPFLQKISGLWSSQAGSLLFWSLIMKIYVWVGVRKAANMPDWRFLPLVTLIFEFMMIFFLVPIIFISNPFEKFWMLQEGTIIPALFEPENSQILVPFDSPGMNPLLRHPAMLLHPPFLYLGLVGFFLPFAFALSSLILGQIEKIWAEKIYKIIIFSWVTLTIGMILGSWWAYTILGWGGYWGWDAVEISGLLPWLISFGLVHSVLIFIRNNELKSWVYFFSLIIVVLILFGILVTRSGIIESVHAYATGAIGPVLTSLIAASLLVSGFFFGRNFGKLRAKNEKRTSVEILTVIFNWILVGSVLLFMLGQTLPITSRFLGLKKTSFTPANYELYSAPLLLALMVVTALHVYFEKGIGKKFPLIFFAANIIVSLLFTLLVLLYRVPNLLQFLGFWSVFFVLISWTTDYLKFYFRISRKDIGPKSIFRKTSTFLIHLGIGLMALGIMGTEALYTSQEVGIQIGETIQIDEISLTTLGREIIEYENGIADLEVPVRVFAPRLFKSSEQVLLMQYYPKLELLNSIPSFSSNVFGDIQIILHQFERSNDGSAVIQVNVFPLINWIWIGGIVMSAGGAIVLLRKGKKD